MSHPDSCSLVIPDSDRSRAAINPTYYCELFHSIFADQIRWHGKCFVLVDQVRDGPFLFTTVSNKRPDSRRPDAGIEAAGAAKN